MRKLALLAAATLLISTGCDDKEKEDTSPQAMQARQAAEQQQQQRTLRDKRMPTTQELLTGSRSTLRLGDFPLMIEAPSDWKLQSWSDGALVFAGGMGSSGEISLQLGKHAGLLKKDMIDKAFAQAKVEAAAKPHVLNLTELRPLGPGLVLEQRLISNEFVGGKLPPEIWGEVELKSEANGRSAGTTRAITNPHLLKWQLTVFMPAGDKGEFVQRTLTFMSLKVSEFEQDRQFLEQLVKSLKHQE